MDLHIEAIPYFGQKNTEDDGWTHLGYWGASPLYYNGQALIPFRDALYC